MVRSRLVLAVAMLAGAAILAAGCGQAGSPVGSGGGQLLVGRVEKLPPAALPPGQLTAAEDAFGLALLRRVCTPGAAGNLLLSPESAAEALGMLYAGAHGPTAAAVGRLLHLPAWQPRLVAALDRHSAMLAGQRQLTITNHLFEQSGVRPAQRVLDDLRTAYRAGLWSVNFGTEPATTNKINGVVAQETHGLVPALFAAPLPSSTRTVLTNTVYLKAHWPQPFPSTSTAPFRTADGQVVQVPLMSNTGPVAGYRQVGGWQSATLRYAGGRLAAVGLLPPAHAAGCAMPSPAQLTALTTTARSQPAGVRLPRMQLTQTWGNLQSTLAAMGLPLSGDYSGLGPADSQISEIVQRDTMTVNATGTTASAATGVAVGTAERAGPALIVTFNRPFLLLLEDTATHTPLFLAWITDPTQP